MHLFLFKTSSFRWCFSFMVNVAYSMLNLLFVKPAVRSVEALSPLRSLLYWMTFAFNTFIGTDSLFLYMNYWYKHYLLHYNHPFLFWFSDLFHFHRIQIHNLSSSFIQSCIVSSLIPHFWYMLTLETPLFTFSVV